MGCDHIVCLPCLRKWINSDNENENNNKCLICRSAFLSRPNDDETGVEEFRERFEELASAEQSATMTPEALATILLEAVDGFLNRFPGCSRYIITPSHRGIPGNLRTLRQLILLTPSEFVSEHQSGFDSERLFDESS
jgi:hypothetical protein